MGAERDPRAASIDEALRAWRQGDCVLDGEHWFAHRLDTAFPITDAARAAAEEGVDLAEQETLGFVVVTQTCDIVRYQELTGRNADYVEIYNLDERKKKPRSVDEDLIGDVKGHVRRAASALRENEMPPVVSARACPACDYLRLCSAGREFVAASKTGTA